MQLEKMYPPQKDSPSTYLTGNVGTEDIYIVVGSVELLPKQVPFPLTLGIDKGVTETVIVTNLGNGNNQITVTRGEQPLYWVAGTKCARVWTANDLTAIQKNIDTVAEQTDTNTTNISDNKEDIKSEVERATEVEIELDVIKVDRKELSTVITNVEYSSDNMTATVTFTTYDADSKKNDTFTRSLPVASSNTAGVMTSESYQEITRLRDDITILQKQGGKFIGISFATYLELQNYTISKSVNTGDFTYVLDDENHEGSTTRYIYNGEYFEFGYVINFDPVGIATSETAGIVLGDTGSNVGKISVEEDGTMSVVGWDKIYPQKELNVTINHGMGKYPIVELLSGIGAYGVGGYGELPYGGSDVQTENLKVLHNDKNSFKIVVPKGLDLGTAEVNEIVEQEEYAIVFDSDTNVSLSVILR